LAAARISAVLEKWMWLSSFCERLIRVTHFPPSSFENPVSFDQCVVWFHNPYIQARPQQVRGPMQKLGAGPSVAVLWRRCARSTGLRPVWCRYFSKI